MTSTTNQCFVCLDPMPSSGFNYYIGQLFPKSHIRKLDGCDHYVHTACFQKYVNRQLVTNWDHRGPVPCGLCRQKTEGEHSSQHGLRVFKVLDVSYEVMPIILKGFGIWCLQKVQTLEKNSKKISVIMLGLALLASSVAIPAFFKRKYIDTGDIVSLWVSCYNFRYGMNIKPEQFGFGIDTEFSVEEWLDNYCTILPLIQILVPTHQNEGEYYIMSFKVENREEFIDEMKKILDEKKDTLPDIVKSASKHFWQIIFNEEQQESFLDFITALAIEKEFINIPRDGSYLLRYNNLTYEKYFAET